MIAIDWGSSSLRAYLLDGQGEIVGERRAPLGILACEGRFEAVLVDQIAGWDDPLIVLGGMIGSRQGWREVPYVPCPAGLSEIAAGMVRIEAASLPGRSVWIVPGVDCKPGDAAPEVMRGEEAQICGLLDALGAGRHRLCLPGTHSKWAVVEQGRIETFATAMTGEIFAVLRQHSLLGRLMQGEAHDDAAFSLGLDRAAQSGGLLHHLFGVRTLGLAGALRSEQLGSYLSGLLIGHEILGLGPKTGEVHLVGSATLIELYAGALGARGVTAKLHGEALVARGIHLLAKAHRLIV